MPVVRLESVRLLLAYAAGEGWLIHHMDVKSAFLNGELQEDVFITQPRGFVVEGEEGKVCACQRCCMGSIRHHRHGTQSWMQS
jgi:hypothetical protein